MTVVLVGGPTAIGKTRFVDAVIGSGDKFIRPKSYTTRVRRESDQSNELEFVSSDEFERMRTAGLFVTVDEVYGNYYAMTRDSVEDAITAGKIVIKEVHPKNHRKIKNILPEVISVLLFPRNADEFWTALEQSSMHLPPDRVRRVKEDKEFYTSPEELFQSADIILLVDRCSTPESLRQEFSTSLSRFLEFRLRHDPEC